MSSEWMDLGSFAKKHEEESAQAEAARQEQLDQEYFSSLPADSRARIIVDDFQPGTETEGVVDSIAVFGVFVDLGRKIRGFVHREGLVIDGSIPHEDHIDAKVSLGDKLELVVTDIDIRREWVNLRSKEELQTGLK